jgi:hypothetical protein
MQCGLTGADRLMEINSLHESLSDAKACSTFEPLKRDHHIDVLVRYRFIESDPVAPPSSTTSCRAARIL